MRQIAYVVGFGLLWDEAELLQNPSVGSDAEVATGQDTHFSGTAARAACDEVGPAYTGLTCGNGHSPVRSWLPARLHGRAVIRSHRPRSAEECARRGSGSPPKGRGRSHRQHCRTQLSLDAGGASRYSYAMASIRNACSSLVIHGWYSRAIGHMQARGRAIAVAPRSPGTDAMPRIPLETAVSGALRSAPAGAPAAPLRGLTSIVYGPRHVRRGASCLG